MTFDRSLHRFFLTGTPLVPQQPVDLSPLAHQLNVVLRMNPHDQILLLDGSGQEFLTEIRHLERKRATGLILSTQPAPPEPACPLTLYQCSLKADKFEWVLQKGVELGVTHFAPVVSARSIVRPAAALLKKYTRWRAIIREAAEQCGRGVLPTLQEPLSWSAALERAAGLRLLPWEALLDQPDAGGQADGLGAVLQTHLQQSVRPTAISLLVGPEGGITAEEATAAQQAGWQVISLGPRVLRAETAALAAVTIIMERLGNLA